jgi:penicillin V acylase-like amidase (Ntn superfamily)
MKRTLTLGLSAALSLAIAAPVADACTRAVYFGLEGQTVTGRTMDWFVSDMDTNMWLYPRGLERSSNTATPLVWTTKYGSVVTTVYEGASADGMNEAGLVANMLYLAESEYPPATEGDTRPTLPVSAWVQYALDNFATVAEAVAALEKEEFRMVTVSSPTGEPGTVHLSISDASGDSAIFQYIGGKLVIYHSRDYQIMTNSPTFDQQLALDAYWNKVGGDVMLPGTNRAADRFVRASYYINEATQTADPRRAIATVFSVMRNVSVPIGIKVPGQPNIADTLWLTVSDQKNKVYYYQDTNSPSILWVNLTAMDFSEGSGPRRLTMDGNPDLAGDQTANFQPTELFKFMSPDVPH